MPAPEWPAAIRTALSRVGLEELHNWWQAFSRFLSSRFDTSGDIRVLKRGGGIILTNRSGTVTKRVRLSDDGNSIVLENVQ